MSTPDGRAWRIQGKPMARVLTGQGGFESPGRLLFAIARGCAQPVVAPVTPAMTPSAIAATGSRSRRRGDCAAAPRGIRTKAARAARSPGKDWARPELATTAWCGPPMGGRPRSPWGLATSLADRGFESRGCQTPRRGETRNTQKRKRRPECVQRVPRGLGLGRYPACTVSRSPEASSIPSSTNRPQDIPAAGR